MTITYEWRGDFDNAALDALHAGGFGYPVADTDWRARVARHSLGWVCARRDGALAGFVNVAWDGGAHAFLLDTVVAPAYRSRGVGASLVARAADGARRAGCAWLHVDFEEHLRPFYLDACGFRETAAGLIALRSRGPGRGNGRSAYGGWYYWCMQEETARSAIDTFISAFNASEDAYVTALLSQALTPDVVFWGPLGRSEGIEAVERFVRDIRRHPAGAGTMVRCSAVDMPDEWARYQWVFTLPDGGPRLAGTDVVHLRRNLIDQVIVFAGDIEPSAP